MWALIFSLFLSILFLVRLDKPKVALCIFDPLAASFYKSQTVGLQLQPDRNILLALLNAYPFLNSNDP